MSGLDPGAGGAPGGVTITFNTAGDDRVCPICAPYNGSQWNSDDPAAVYPPLHPRCRCYLTYADSEEAVDPADIDPPSSSGGGDPSLQGSVKASSGPAGTAARLAANSINPPDPDPTTQPGVGPWNQNVSTIPAGAKGGPWT